MAGPITARPVVRHPARLELVEPRLEDRLDLRGRDRPHERLHEPQSVLGQVDPARRAHPRLPRARRHALGGPPRVARIVDVGEQHRGRHRDLAQRERRLTQAPLHSPDDRVLAPDHVRYEVRVVGPLALDRLAEPDDLVPLRGRLGPRLLIDARRDRHERLRRPAHQANARLDVPPVPDSPIKRHDGPRWRARRRAPPRRRSPQAPARPRTPRRRTSRRTARSSPATPAVRSRASRRRP